MEIELVLALVLSRLGFPSDDPLEAVAVDRLAFRQFAAGVQGLPNHPGQGNLDPIPAFLKGDD